MFGRFGQFLHGLYNTQIFDLEADLNFEKEQRQLFAQFEAAGEMKREQQYMLSNQVTGGYMNSPYALNASFYASFNNFFGSVVKWIMFLGLVCIAIGVFVSSKATLSTGGFLLMFSVVYLFYTQGPTRGRFYMSSFPLFVALLVGIISAVVLYILSDRLFKAVHGSEIEKDDRDDRDDRDEAIRKARKL